MNRPVMPSSIAPPAARYAHAVLTERAGRLLHTSGVVPVSPDGTVPVEIGDQAATVWSNIELILTAAGMGITDIVCVTTYVVAGHELGPVMATRDRVFGDHIAASTLVTVPMLARPEWSVEVAVVAASALNDAGGGVVEELAQLEEAPADVGERARGHDQAAPQQ